MRIFFVGVVVLLLAVPSASAALPEPALGTCQAGPVHAPHRVSWLVANTDLASVVPTASVSRPVLLAQAGTSAQADPRGGEAQPLHAAAVEHSQAYETRRKIHKIASFATLPLFGAELWLGQSLYNNSADVGTRRAAHGVVGAGIVGLAAVNTVTGAWNLFGEGWHDPNGRTLRLVHGLLMMAADVGFAATSQTGPNSESRRQTLTFASNKVTHRNLAVASISVGTAGYLLMLIGNR